MHRTCVVSQAQPSCDLMPSSPSCYVYADCNRPCAMHSPTGERLLAVGYCVIADGLYRPTERPIGAPLFRQDSVS